MWEREEGPALRCVVRLRHVGEGVEFCNGT